ncbi:MAG: response regulator transcription factor [Chthoniobacteraceae bacterium]|jgi:DNA-binding response OmpR family regulator
MRAYRVKTASDGERGLDEALRVKPDLIVLDLMLPKVNGYEICRLLRREKLEMPIIMLTAKSEEADLVLGLHIGADDYVTKPFRVKELLARAEAFLRRSRMNAPEMFRFGDCEFDSAARRLARGGGEIKLSPKEYELLHYFLTNAGRALSREQILNSVWGYDRMVTPRSIDRFVTSLRQKIEQEPQHPEYIHTVREYGYKFVLT